MNSNAAPDWRASIRTNHYKTLMTITIFCLMYLGLGLALDVASALNQYPTATVKDILSALLQFQLLPFYTLLFLGVAVISLLVTFTLNNRLMLLGTEYSEVTPDTAKSPQELQLYNVVEELKIAAGLRYMPKVYIIHAPYMNAFASGYSEKSAMVAITSGLMNKLTRAELQAVMAHELSHIRRMDIKLTLMASVLANLILIALDLLMSAFYRRNTKNSGGGLYVIIIILRFLLPMINVLLLLYLSRTREYMADAGAVELTRDNQALASALLKINQDHLSNADSYKAAYNANSHENIRREAYIYDPRQAGISSLSSIMDVFSTHPTLEKRLRALGISDNKHPR